MAADDILEILGLIAKIIGILVMGWLALYAVGWLIFTPVEWLVRQAFG